MPLRPDEIDEVKAIADKMISDAIAGMKFTAAQVVEVIEPMPETPMIDKKKKGGKE